MTSTELSCPVRFGVALRRWRQRQGWSAKSLGHRIGASGTYVLFWEQGTKPPPHPDSVIGRACYALVGFAPSPTERRWWQWWTVDARAVRTLAQAVAQRVEYAGTAEQRLAWQDSLPRKRTAALEAFGDPGPSLDWLIGWVTHVAWAFADTGAATLSATVRSLADPVVVCLSDAAPDPPV